MNIFHKIDIRKFDDSEENNHPIINVDVDGKQYARIIFDKDEDAWVLDPVEINFKVPYYKDLGKTAEAFKRGFNNPIQQTEREKRLYFIQNIINEVIKQISNNDEIDYGEAKLEFQNSPVYDYLIDDQNNIFNKDEFEYLEMYENYRK